MKIKIPKEGIILVYKQLVKWSLIVGIVLGFLLGRFSVNFF